MIFIEFKAKINVFYSNILEKNNKKHMGKASSDLTFSGMMSDGETENKSKKSPVYGKSKFVRAITGLNKSNKKSYKKLIFFLIKIMYFY